MKVSVYDKSGKKTSKSVELSDSIYGIEPNDHAIYLDVKLIMANKRQVLTSQKRELRLLVVLVRSRSKKEQVLLVRVVSSLVSSEVVDVSSAHAQETTGSN